MKKKYGSFYFVIAFVLSIFMFSGITAYGANNVTIKKLKVEVDGKETEEVAGCFIDGKAYIKLVDLCDITGYYLAYDKTRKEYVISTVPNMYLTMVARDKNNGYGKTFDNIKVKKLAINIAYKHLYELDGCSINEKAYVKLADFAEITKYDLKYDKTDKKYVLTSENSSTNSSGQTEDKKDVESKTGGYGTTSQTTKKGDVIDTTDGTYTIEVPKTTKESALPTWQEEWDAYPRVEFPTGVPERYKGTVGKYTYDSINIVNEYELERLIRTIYAYAKQNPDLWKDDNPSTNIPNFSIKIGFEDDMVYNTFYPWRDSEVENLVVSTFGGTVFRIYAVDVYNNGKFNETQYFLK